LTRIKAGANLAITTVVTAKAISRNIAGILAFSSGEDR
jgi:hypothetical protein